MPSSPLLLPPDFSRRRLLLGMAAGGGLLGLGAAGMAHAAAPASMPRARCGTPPELRGTEFDLVVSEAAVDFTGTPRVATVINGSFPGPVLRWREGDTVTIRVTNRLRETTSIHWHGIQLPYQMDGVPGVSFAGIAPGQTFTYRFRVRQHGTYWYHSHSGMQELTGMHGAIVIDPADPADDIRADCDHVVQLSDWTDTDPMRVLMRLRQQGSYYNDRQPTAAQFARDAAHYGLDKAVAMRRMWNAMRMSPADLADVSGPALTCLMNGLPSGGNWTGLFRKGQTVRLRCINAAAHTFYDVRIPGLSLRVVAADGVRVEPVSVDEFRFGPGETYDVLVTPRDDACTLYAQTMARAGHVRGTLAVRPGLAAPVPAPDPFEPLTMRDMMGDMAHGDAPSGTSHAHGSQPPAGAASASGMDMSSMSMDDSGGSMSGHAHAHAHAPEAGAGASRSTPPQTALAVPSRTVHHARSEYGPGTDMRVDMPRTNLDDPGIGLRHTGRRTLTLADLHTLGGPLDPRGPERELEFHLTGNMERYAWQFDGLEFGQSTPVHFGLGERVRIILHNDTMMTHPMHMHGLWQELETPDGRFQARKHTLPVQPAQRVSYLMTADAAGRWVWHCHLMFHMEMGMFREVVIH